MIHPLIRLAASRPELLAEHGEAYVALIGKEISQWRAGLVRRAVMGVVAAVAALLSLTFIGVALMVWGGAPESEELRAVWALLAPPIVMILITAIAGYLAIKGPATSSVIDDLKAQFHADLAMLREVNVK